MNNNELIFKEYERLINNYNICLLGFREICSYVKNKKSKPTRDLMVIGCIIENVLNNLKDAPTEADTND